jgi:PHD/YefM family antitoxin component YafN of YafNO toxin-antitoxin module
MIPVQPQYIVDDQQNRMAIILPVEEWKKILEELEELEDLRAYDEAHSGSREAIPFEQAVSEIQEGLVG